MSRAGLIETDLDSLVLSENAHSFGTRGTPYLLSCSIRLKALIEIM